MTPQDIETNTPKISSSKHVISAEEYESVNTNNTEISSENSDPPGNIQARRNFENERRMNNRLYFRIFLILINFPDSEGSSKYFFQIGKNNKIIESGENKKIFSDKRSLLLRCNIYNSDEKEYEPYFIQMNKIER